MLTQRIGVAKGTFYHYFKSKEDLLTQWVLFEMSPVLEYQEKIANHPEFDALTKMNMIMAHGRDWKIQHMDMILSLIKIMYDDHNIRLRVEMTRQSIRLSENVFGKIIKQGVKEGIFHTEYPEVLATKLPQISQLFAEDFGLILLRHQEGNNIFIEDIKRTIKVWQHILERTLGTPKGSLVLIDDRFINELFDHISKHKSEALA